VEIVKDSFDASSYHLSQLTDVVEHLETQVGVMAENVASYQDFLNNLLEKLPSMTGAEQNDLVKVVKADGKVEFFPEDKEY
jgi:Mg2+ and Co2+ transporter CorA